jgi:hypothetical protein
MEIIKSIKEEINHKYDIREVFFINLKDYSNLRFLNFKSAFNFYCDLVNNGCIKEVL